MYVRYLAHIFGISLVTDNDINLIKCTWQNSFDFLLAEPDFAPGDLNFFILLVELGDIILIEVIEHLLYGLMSISKLPILLLFFEHVVQIFLNFTHSLIHLVLKYILFVWLRL